MGMLLPVTGRTAWHPVRHSTGGVQHRADMGHVGYAPGM